MSKKLDTIKKFIKVVNIALKNKSIIIAAPYFNNERLKDGYYKRVKAVDELLSNYKKIYISYENYSKELSYRYPDENTIVVDYSPYSKKHKIMLAFLIFICGKIYCHSVWQAKKTFYKIPFTKVFVDVHGVVPEEETLYGRYEAAQMYGDIEEIVVQKSACLICVTNKIAEHLKNKYGKKFKSKTIVLPIFDKVSNGFVSKGQAKPLTTDNKPIITYAGGTMKWQKIELMQDAIFKQIDSAVYKICVPNPEEFWKTWKHSKDLKNLLVESKTYTDLCNNIYPISHYGFVLRDDIVVNNVACPTKIAEYLQYDIIPIVNTPNIGDFKDLGMKYLKLEDFISGNFYNDQERKQIVENNRLVFKKYIDMHNKGIEDLKKLFA